MFLGCARFDIWPLAWIALVPLLWLLDRIAREDSGRWSAFGYGLVTGLVANGGGFYWITSLLERFAHLPAIGAIPLYLLLIAYQALLYGAFGLLVVELRRRSGDRLPLGLLGPLVMVPLELVTPFIFPWYYAITQGWVRPIIQIADVTGPLGVTALLLLVNGGLADLAIGWQRRRALVWRPMAVAATLVGAALTYGVIRIHQVMRARASSPRLRVGLVQPNIGIPDESRYLGFREQIGRLRDESVKLEGGGAQLVVWPEGSYPAPIPEHPVTRELPAPWSIHVPGFEVPVVVGALTLDRSSPSREPYNSAFLLDEHGQVDGFYDKNFLMMFGEYIPFYDQMKWIQSLVPAASNLQRGHEVSVLHLHEPGAPPGGWRLAPLICYEDILPAFVRRFDAERPNLLVNITNDAWFGATSEPWEHLELAVYRSVEHRLDMVRAVNTGVSAFIDSTGKVYAHTESVDPGERPAAAVSLLDEVALQDSVTVYDRVGDLFGELALLALLGVLGFYIAKGRRPANAP